VLDRGGLLLGVHLGEDLTEAAIRTLEQVGI
jgi:hypothetical protein